MFNRNDLTLTLFYASSTSDEGSKVAMFTVQVSMRHKSSIWMHETSLKVMPQQTRRRKNGICILSTPKALKPMK